MSNSETSASCTATDDEQHVQHRHSNRSNATADECHATNVPTVNEHGGIEAATNNVWNAAQSYASAALPTTTTDSPQSLPATVPTTVSTTVPTE